MFAMFSEIEGQMLVNTPRPKDDLRAVSGVGEKSSLRAWSYL